MSVTEIALRPSHELAIDDGELSVERIVRQAQKIQECMKAVMKVDEHYGVIPGTGGRDGKPPKPTLLKPGAEKLCLMFRLCPEYETMHVENSPAGISYTIRCLLTHIPTGNRIATGLGSCNSREKKYTRPADKRCPKCGKESIIKGKEEYGGGWVCFARKGGCNAKYKDGDATIEQQDNGIADPSDLANTILKMACKRALVAAVLNGTAASDCFTQDLEDLATKAAEYEPPAEHPAEAPARAELRDRVEREGGSSPKAPAPGVGARSQAGMNFAPVTHKTADAPAVSTCVQTPPSGNVIDWTTAAELPDADKVTHEGVPRTLEENSKLYGLKSDCGGVFSGDDDTPNSLWRMKVIGIYRDPKGERITSSTQLSRNQAGHLIERMSRYLRKVNAKHERATQDMTGNGSARQAPPPPVTSVDLIERIHAQFQFASEEDAWLETLGWKTADEIPEESRHMIVLLLESLKAGPEAYQTQLTKARALGHIQPEWKK